MKLKNLLVGTVLEQKLTRDCWDVIHISDQLLHIKNRVNQDERYYIVKNGDVDFRINIDFTLANSLWMKRDGYKLYNSPSMSKSLCSDDKEEFESWLENTGFLELTGITKAKNFHGEYLNISLTLAFKAWSAAQAVIKGGE